MNMNKISKEQFLNYILSFSLPILIWISVCVVRGIYPFGSNSIMTGDMTYQFVDYLAYFKTIIFSNNDFFYSFSKTIGGDLAGFSAYYLFSPFNLIILFFSNRMMPLGLLVIIILKSGFMSLSFNYMLNKLYGFRIESFVFSVTYSLTGYAVVYYQLYEYFDCLFLLPLIVLGIHSIINNPKKKYLYIICLFLAISINYYIGWMICIFCVMYFLYELFIQNKGWKEILSFGASSFIAGIMSAGIVIPAVLSMQGEKDDINIGFYATMNILELPERFLINSFKGNVSDCLPNIYFGLVLLVFAVLYFSNKKISKREKIASMVFVAVIIINLLINTFNVVWHGLNNPIGFPYRYSFILSFLLIIFSYKNWINFDKENLDKKILVIAVVVLSYIIVISIRGNVVLVLKDIIINVLILLLIVSVLYLYKIEKITIRLFIIAISVLQIFEISENLYDSFKYFELTDIAEYQTYIDEVSEEIDKIKESDDGFYRLEKLFRRSHNDAMQFNYNGLTHYSSCEKKEYIKFMEKLGFRNNGNWTFYDCGSTAFVDALFGVKYIISQYDTTGKPYDEISANDEKHYYSFINPYALPMLFGSSESIGSVKYKDNTFEFQNDIADSINGKNNRIFSPADIKTINYCNLNVEEKDGVNKYTRINKDEKAYIEYIISPLEKRKGRRLELYFKAPSVQEAIITKDDKEYWEYFNKYNWNIIDIGHARKKDVSIKIELQSDELELEDSFIYYENGNALNRWFSSINNEENYLKKISSSKLVGKYKAETDGRIVFAFPYDKGWKIKIDGIESESLPAAEQLLSTKVSKGNHEIELTYIPEGLVPGIILSIIGLCGLIVLIIIDKHKILWSKNFLKK